VLLLTHRRLTFRATFQHRVHGSRAHYSPRFSFQPRKTRRATVSTIKQAVAPIVPTDRPNVIDVAQEFLVPKLDNVGKYSMIINSHRVMSTGIIESKGTAGPYHFNYLLWCPNRHVAYCDVTYSVVLLAEGCRNFALTHKSCGANSAHTHAHVRDCHSYGFTTLSDSVNQSSPYGCPNAERGRETTSRHWKPPADDR